MFLARIQEDLIDVHRMLDELSSSTKIFSIKQKRNKIEKNGALVLFYGIVRSFGDSGGAKKKVLHLEYESYTALAQKIMEKILEGVIQKHSLDSCACVHRLGVVLPGQNAVVVMTTSQHRREAYVANCEIIDRVKTEVPLWKKEVYNDGSYVWGSECCL